TAGPAWCCASITYQTLAICACCSNLECAGIITVNDTILGKAGRTRAALTHCHSRKAATHSTRGQCADSRYISERATRQITVSDRTVVNLCASYRIVSDRGHPATVQRYITGYALIHPSTTVVLQNIATG